LFISREGDILGTHRKLKPTMLERVAWGEGDGSDLVVFERPYGRLSGLNRWEHQTMLLGYTLIAQGTQFQLDAELETNAPLRSLPNPFGRAMHLLSQAFAAQAACYVIGAAGLLIRDAVDERIRPLAFDITGDSIIVDPRGEIVAGPVRAKDDIFVQGVVGAPARRESRQ
jgi:nitrilase